MALRQAAGSPAIEIDGLKTQLANVRRDLNKAINEKMALEAKSRKDIEAVKNQLDDANFELDNMRRDLEDGGSVSKKDMEKQKKSWEGERQEMQVKIGRSETVAKERQSEINDLKSELTEVRTQVDALTAEKSQLEQSLSTVRREKDDLVEVANRLTLETTNLGEKLSTQLEELEEERVTSRNAAKRVEEAEAMISSGDIQLAKLSEDLEAAITLRTSLESKIAELQDTLANRSTESEADARDTELSQLRSELEIVRSTLAEKETESQREVQILSFTKEQDAKSAKEQLDNLQSELDTARMASQAASDRASDQEISSQQTIDDLRAEITTLEQRVKSLQSELSAAKDTADASRALLPPATLTKTSHTPDHVGLLYAKIQSLRADRDGLRQELSFAQNESRFTVSAAQADRKSALEELEKVKNSISSQTVIRDALEAEINMVRTQLSEKEIRLEETKALYAGVTVDKGDVADAIAQYESDAAESKARQADLIAQLQDSQQTIIELNHAMVIMRSNTDTDKRHRKISMERKAEMSMITETSDGLAASEGGVVSFGASRRPGHTRTRSEIAALVLPDQAQMSALTGRVAELEAEIKILSGKLERRNGKCSLDCMLHQMTK